MEIRELIKDLHEIRTHGTQLELHDLGILLANIQVQSPPMEKIKLAQVQDPHLEKWKILSQDEKSRFEMDQDEVLKC